MSIQKYDLSLCNQSQMLDYAYKMFGVSDNDSAKMDGKIKNFNINAKASYFQERRKQSQGGYRK